MLPEDETEIELVIPEDEVEKPCEMVTCPKCGQKFGSYLHFCPNCRNPNSSEQYMKYWGKQQ